MKHASFSHLFLFFPEAREVLTGGATGGGSAGAMGGNESTAAGTEESVGRPPVMYSHSMELMETAGGAAAGGACQAPAGGTSSGRSRGTSITETMAEHFGAKKTHAFIVHLVNEDLSAVRPIVLEVHGSGLAFAHPKAPFQAFKRFALDELAGWKATDASFTFVSVTVSERAVGLLTCAFALPLHLPSPRPSPPSPTARGLLVFGMWYPNVC